jgi:membrane carboxypeptidase/penicillin-binding protein
MIGGRSFRKSPFNRNDAGAAAAGLDVQALRVRRRAAVRPRSTDSISDGPVAIVMPAGNTWRPQNYQRSERNGRAAPVASAVDETPSVPAALFNIAAP